MSSKRQSLAAEAFEPGSLLGLTGSLQRCWDLCDSDLESAQNFGAVDALRRQVVAFEKDILVHLGKALPGEGYFVSFVAIAGASSRRPSFTAHIMRRNAPLAGNLLKEIYCLCFQVCSGSKSNNATAGCGRLSWPQFGNGGWVPVSFECVGQVRSLTLFHVFLLSFTLSLRLGNLPLLKLHSPKSCCGDCKSLTEISHFDK
jgi:hypothetical protein